MSPVVHPTDFSDCSQAALRFASETAARQRCKLLIVHVVDPAVPFPMVPKAGVGTYPIAGVTAPLPQAEANATSSTARQHLEAIVPTIPEVVVEHCLLEGEPGREIASFAARTGASQIVMGSHGRRGLSRMLLGSVAESVVRLAECPVTIVKITSPNTPSG